MTIYLFLFALRLVAIALANALTHAIPGYYERDRGTRRLLFIGLAALLLLPIEILFFVVTL